MVAYFLANGEDGEGWSLNASAKRCSPRENRFHGVLVARTRHRRSERSQQSASNRRTITVFPPTGRSLQLSCVGSIEAFGSLMACAEGLQDSPSRPLISWARQAWCDVEMETILLVGRPPLGPPHEAQTISSSPSSLAHPRNRRLGGGRRCREASSAC